MDNINESWDEPIKGTGNAKDTVQQIIKLIEKNYALFGGWANTFEQIIDLALYALQQEEEKYMQAVSKMDKRAVQIASEIVGLLIKAFCYDYCIWDYLGEIYMQVASLSKSKALGQLFTPFHICEVMAKMNLGNVKERIVKAKVDNKNCSIMEPCVGSGAMLLACKKVIIEEAGLAGLDYFEFVGSDIDSLCVKMCKIQMILTDYRYMVVLMLEQVNKLQCNPDKYIDKSYRNNDIRKVTIERTTTNNIVIQKGKYHNDDLNKWVS